MGGTFNVRGKPKSRSTSCSDTLLKSFGFVLKCHSNFSKVTENVTSNFTEKPVSYLIVIYETTLSLSPIE